ncbi:hypothetical protein F4604DRAFT_1679178 [Suillus subluteus]|nr:hypothetical protein F4604DRAFT_1679178 [Suillus subluteus]
MTCIITETKDTSLALGARHLFFAPPDTVVKLLSVLNLTDNDRAVLVSALLSDIAKPHGEASAQDAADSQTGSSFGNNDDEDLAATTAAISDAGDATTVTVPDASSSATMVAADSTPTVATSVVTVMDEDDGFSEVEDVIVESCILNAYKGVYFNVPVSSDAAPPLYYVTRGHKISVFSGWGNVSPKVLGVSCTIFAKVKTIDQGIEALTAAIDAGTAARMCHYLHKTCINLEFCPLASVIVIEHEQLNFWERALEVLDMMTPSSKCPEEQAKAAHMYRQNYYQRNCEQFRLNNKKRYRQRKCRPQDQVNDEDTDAEISESHRDQIHQPCPGLPKHPTSESEPPIKNNADAGLPNGPQRRQW